MHDVQIHQVKDGREISQSTDDHAVRDNKAEKRTNFDDHFSFSKVSFENLYLYLTLTG